MGNLVSCVKWLNDKTGEKMLNMLNIPEADDTGIVNDLLSEK